MRYIKINPTLKMRPNKTHGWGLEHQKNQNRMDKLLLIGLTIAAIAFIALLVSLPVMLLWNWLMPELFNLKEITWMQALGLTLLCGFLFPHYST
jgi:hypothetical protein